MVSAAAAVLPSPPLTAVAAAMHAGLQACNRQPAPGARHLPTSEHHSSMRAAVSVAPAAAPARAPVPRRAVARRAVHAPGAEVPPLSDEVAARLAELNIDFEKSGLKYLTNEARVRPSVWAWQVEGAPEKHQLLLAGTLSSHASCPCQR